MIKNLQPNDVQVTPFSVIKSWDLLNSQVDDLVLIEEPAKQISVAQDFVDYEDGTNPPIINRECSIALEQQTPDAVLYEEGINKTGTFYPDEEDRNINGTFKRLVFNQIKNAFYNQYQNPTQIFGLENIDLQKNQTRKFVSDQIRVFTIPKSIFGEKIVEGSVTLVDNSLDDFYEIHDDRCGNLIAGNNLFSKVQEVRKFENILSSGSNLACQFYSASNLQTVFPYDPIMWLKASDTSSLSIVNNRVEGWRDSSGNSNGTSQPVSYKQPEFHYGVSDAHNSVRFNNTFGTESIKLNHDLVIVPPYTILVVGQTGSGATQRSLAYFDVANFYAPYNSGSAVQPGHGTFMSSSKISEFFGVVVSSSMNMEFFYYSSGSGIQYSKISGSEIFVSSVAKYIGGGADELDDFSGSIHELIVFNRGLEKDKIENLFSTYIYPKFQPVFW